MVLPQDLCSCSPSTRCQPLTVFNSLFKLTNSESCFLTPQSKVTLPWGWEGTDWEFGISRCKLLYIEWINNKILLYNTENYIQNSVINLNGKEYIYVYNSYFNKNKFFKKENKKSLTKILLSQRIFMIKSDKNQLDIICI